MIPPTVHPMLVHFPIALLFTSFLLDIVAVWRRDRFFERAGLVLLWMTLISVTLAILAGLYAASHVLVTPTVKPLLAAHRRDGIITGLVIALVVFLRLPRHRAWTRRRPDESTLRETFRSWAAPLGAYALGLILISVTGDLGGSMVYGHALGVAALPPTTVESTRSAKTPSRARSTPTTTAGQQIYVTTCARCHGPTPPFTSALVSSMGASAMQQFISTRMPPGNPVSSSQAKALVQYFNSL